LGRVTVLEVIHRSTEFLTAKGVRSPRLQIELLLAHVLEVPRLKLYLDFDRVLKERELETLRELVRRRGAREPLQRIVGSTSFCGLEFTLDREVLIPRPESELLAERAWTLLEALGEASPCVLDFGTGSGCLGVTVAAHCPRARVYALDVSAAALAVARENAGRHGVLNQLEFWQGDGFGAVPAGMRFDVVLSNPPYIPTAEIATLEPEVRDHDPHLALDGGPDGLTVIRRLAAEAPPFLRPQGRLLLEFGDGQATAVQSHFEGVGWRIESIECDYHAKPRILVACRLG